MTWETSILCEDYDSDVISQLAEKMSDTSCNICGFYIDRTTVKQISSTSFTGEYEIKANILKYIVKKLIIKMND